MRTLNYKPLLLFLVSVSLLTSCASNKKIAYLIKMKDTTMQSAIRNLEPVIQKNDLLSISVSSINQEATQVFNVPNNNAVVGTNSSITNSGYSNQAVGYLVNQDGYIQFPVLGSVQAAGLTKKELTDKIEKELVNQKLLVNPIVNVRYLNYRVTVLGEVGKPMVINVPNERISLLEALGLAGDITIYGKKDNVLVIRETEGQKVVNRINLNSQDLFNSPFYYLQSNDVVYVEPNRAKANSSSTVHQWLPYVISGLTLIVITFQKWVNIK